MAWLVRRSEWVSVALLALANARRRRAGRREIARDELDRIAWRAT